MDCLRIQGGIPLRGSIAASGAKNAALPIMAASILASRPVVLRGVPELSDIDTLSLLLHRLGVEMQRRPNGSLQIETIDDQPTRAERKLVERMRASFCVLGPLVARRGRGVAPLPGGCEIGPRPVDLHLKGLAALGAEIRMERGWVIAEARRLRGAEIDLHGLHGPTVTGTANILSAATLARGSTIIRGAAMEPEVADLGRFLIALGARISGLGTDTLEVVGVEALGGADHAIIPDRIEAGTLLIAGAISRGDVLVTNARPEHLNAVLEALTDAGCQIDHTASQVRVRMQSCPRGLQLTARPYPGIPTDLQAQFTALLALGEGRSSIRDTVFPERFMHVAELSRMGARIGRDGSSVRVQGVSRLAGADIQACDLRASAALVLAGLAAEGTTRVHGLAHLDRGYERLDQKLTALGARIERVPAASIASRGRALASSRR